MCNATCTVYGRHGRRHPCRDAELSFGPDCSENHSDSPDVYIDMVVDVPVGQVQQIPRVLSVTPQLHASYSFLDNVVDMPVVYNDKCPYLRLQKTAKVPQLQRSSRWPMSLVCRFRCRRSSAVVNVPVIIQRQVSSLRCGGASDSVHRQSRGHSRCARETGTWRYGGGDGAFLTHFASFFALLRLCRS